MFKLNESLNFVGDGLIKVAANSAAGFNYPYYLFIPETFADIKESFLYVEPNNSGKPSDDFTFEEDDAHRRCLEMYPNRLARKLNVPLLMPVFPRPKQQSLIYTHYLNRKTMLVKDGPLRRLDLQLIAMIDHARDLFKKSGVQIYQKVFMHGFSASAGFALRFTTMHPEVVKAAAGGGVNALPILPVSKLDGETLRYPLGVADLREISGREFNLKNLLQVPQYIYMGYWDINDTTTYEDCWEKHDADLIARILGMKLMPDRWDIVKKIFASVNSEAQIVSYNSTGHTINPEIEDDLARFFDGNRGSKIDKVKPHNYPFIELKTIKKRHITKIAWKSDPSLPAFVRSNEKGRVVIAVEEWNEQQGYQELTDFYTKANFNGYLRSAVGENITIDRSNFAGTVSAGDGTFQGYVFTLSEAQLNAMQAGSVYRLEVKNNDSSDYRWITVENLILEKKK